MALVIISLKINLFSPWYCWKIAEFGIKQQSLTHINNCSAYFKYGIWLLLYINKSQFVTSIQYSQGHTMINHCDRRITLLSDIDISFVLFNISSKFLLYLECYLLSSKMHKKVSKYIKQNKRYYSITKKSDTSITVIYHGMSLTVL
jgi:hypothetical protein